MFVEIPDTTLKSLLVSPYLNGTGTHYIGSCPICKKEDHFYLQRKTDRINKRGQNVSYFWECKKCGENGTIYKLLKILDKLSLLRFGVSIEHTRHLKKISLEDDQELDLTTPSQLPPIGFKRIRMNFYLEKERGFISEHFEKYQIGLTELLPSLKNFIVFLVIEDGDCKGYVARNIMSKEWIDIKNEERQIFNELNPYKKKPKILRWDNSVADFGKLVFGIDEIIEDQTKTVIIVEGVTSKANVDKHLELFNNDEMKCVCTFGKKISEWQIAKLQRRGIENVILLYDPDAIDQSKKYAFELTTYFNTQVGFITDLKKDPGNLTFDELLVILDDLENPLTFSLNKIQKRIFT